jgi:uncharacterized repeat protein (TIGR03847 family)
VTRRIISFSHPQRFVVGTVGQPGDRTFFLQVADSATPVSVVCEKEQASVLAEKVIELLDQVRRSGVEVPQDADEELIDTDPLAQPIEPEFRVSSMGIGWDPGDESVIIEAHGESEDDAVPDIGDDTGNGPDTLARAVDPGRRPRILHSRQSCGSRRPSAVPVLPSTDRSRRAHLPTRKRVPTTPGMTHESVAARGAVAGPRQASRLIQQRACCAASRR